MGYGSNDLLFRRVHIFDVIRNHEQMATNAPAAIDDNRLLNTPTEDLVDEVVEKCALNVPTLDREQAWVDSAEGPVVVHDYWARDVEPGHTVPGTILQLSIPFTGDRDFFEIQPGTSNFNSPRARATKGAVLIGYSAVELNSEHAKAELNRSIDSIEQHLVWLRQSTEPFNEKLKVIARTAIEARKAKVLKDRNSVASLGFNLKSRPEAPKTYSAPVTRKPIAVRSPLSTAPFKPEPVLEEETYGQILKIIDGMAHVMERSPSAFAKMGEEDLRQHFLVQLNGQFEGAASGETFNFTGKTDILVRAQDRNIFIAECKFWSGEKAFLETISQLLGYLSWRDTKTAIVIFNRNVDFSGMLTAMEGAIAKHSNLKRGPDKESETRFRCVFGNPIDANREVIVTVMAFNVPRS